MKLDKQTITLLWVLGAFVVVVVVFVGMVAVYQNSQVESQYGQGFAEKAAQRDRSRQAEGEDNTPPTPHGPGMNESDIHKLKGRNYDTY